MGEQIDIAIDLEAVPVPLPEILNLRRLVKLVAGVWREGRLQRLVRLRE